MRAAYLGYLAVTLPVFAVLVVLPSWGLVWILPGRRPSVVIERALTRALLRLAWVRTTVVGREHLPDRGPIILASNHTSFVDTAVLLAHLPLEVRIVAKQEVLGWPLIGTFVRRGGHPTVDRWDFRRSLEDRKRVVLLLEAGTSIHFFPEGTFGQGAGLRPFRLGAFETAVETGVPVVPVALQRTRQILPAGRILPRPGRVRLWIGPPIMPEGEGSPAVIALRDRVFEAIATHCGEPALETFIGGPATPGIPARARP